MSARTRHVAELAARLWVACEQRHGKPSFPNYERLAQDVEKLIWLAASLKRVAEKSGPGVITRHERRLTQVITDTLKPYGLTWEPSIANLVLIRFNDGHFTL